MTRAVEYSWINQLGSPEKAELNELVRIGCVVRAANHLDDGIHVSVSYRGAHLLTVVAPALSAAFSEACAETRRQLFTVQG